VVKEATGIDGAMAEGTSRPHCCRLVQIGTYRVGLFACRQDASESSTERQPDWPDEGRPTETRLPGWPCRTRTQKRRRKLSLWKVAQIRGNPVEFRPQRLFAFELRRWGYAARA